MQEALRLRVLAFTRFLPREQEVLTAVWPDLSEREWHQDLERDAIGKMITARLVGQ